MKVKARQGLRVPYETKPTKYITSDVAVVVPDSAYYIRRRNEGDLIDATDATTSTPTASADSSKATKEA